MSSISSRTPSLAKAQQARLWRTIAMTALALLFVAILKITKQTAYDEGYNDAYNTGQADGWQGCIEENNLYERYKE